MAFVIVFELQPSVNAPERSCRGFPNLRMVGDTPAEALAFGEQFFSLNLYPA